MLGRFRRFFNRESKYAKTDISGDGNNIVLQNVVITPDLLKKEILELASKGESKEAARKFKILMDSIPAQHPLFPYWRYEVSLVNGNPIFNHIANTPDAKEKHPLHGTMRFSLGGEYRGFKNMEELIRYSYNKQLDIKVNIIEFKVWIGSLQIDEYNENDNATAIISPPKFPPPVPMRLYFSNDSFSIDYLEMGFVEIDAPYYILNNKHQMNAEIRFELKINFNDSSDCRFSFELIDEYRNYVKANRIFNEFFMKVKENKVMNLKLLKENITIFSASGYNMDNPIPSTIGNLVSILKKLEEIEEFYKVKFFIDDEGIPTKDLDKIEILYKAMKNEPRKGKYTNISINIEVNENLAEKINIIGSKDGESFSIVTEGKQIELLGQIVTFDEYIVEFFNPEIKNKDSTFKKLELMDVGEVIKMEFVPSQKRSKKRALCLEHYKYNKQ